MANIQSVIGFIQNTKDFKEEDTWFRGLWFVVANQMYKLATEHRTKKTALTANVNCECEMYNEQKKDSNYTQLPSACVCVHISMSPINSRNNLINALHNVAISAVRVCERWYPCPCPCPCPCGCNQFDSFIQFFFLERHSTIYHLMEFISSQHVFRLLFRDIVNRGEKKKTEQHK